MTTGTAMAKASVKAMTTNTGTAMAIPLLKLRCSGATLNALMSNEITSNVAYVT